MFTNRTPSEAAARNADCPRWCLRSGLTLLAACAFVLLSGCAGGTTTTTRNSTLQTALDAYAAGKYAMAGDQAKAVAMEETGITRDQANYLAGLSAYHTNGLSEAEGYFRQAERSTDAATAANARAMLGVIRLREDRPAEAASYLERASGNLAPSDAREAARWTAFAYELTGDLPSAARARQASATPTAARSGQPCAPGTTDPAPASSSSASTGLFALQIGAFSRRDGAEQAAKQAAAATTGSDLGPVRVFEANPADGKPRFLVQVGAFNTRSAAASARKRVGQLAYIVAPAADGRILDTVWPDRSIAEAQQMN